MTANAHISDGEFVRRNELDLTLEANGDVSVFIGEQSIRVGPVGLMLLEQFNKPTALKQGLTSIIDRLPSDYAIEDAFAILEQFSRYGIIKPRNQLQTLSSRFYPFGFYDSAGVQIRILNDRKRRQAYLKAVRETVRPGDVVLDLGSGNGILSVAAVRAGAAKVYAIEPAKIGENAAVVARENGVADRIEFISGWSHLLNLPEKCDVLIFDIVGSEPLEMGVIEATVDALKRHLKPDAKIVPRGIELCLLLAKSPADWIADYIYNDTHFARWQEWYGIDFRSLQQDHQGSIPLYVDPMRIAAFEKRSTAANVWSLDLSRPGNPSFTGLANAIVSELGDIDCAVGVVTIKLSEDTVFVADPWEPGDSPHWMAPVWGLPVPLRHVKPGDSIEARYSYLGRGRSGLSLALAKPSDQ